MRISLPEGATGAWVNGKYYPVDVASYRLLRVIRVRFNNSKKQGRFGLRSYEAYAAIFPGGHVALDSEDAPRQGYASEREMREDLERFGACEIEEVGEVRL